MSGFNIANKIANFMNGNKPKKPEPPKKPDTYGEIGKKLSTSKDMAEKIRKGMSGK